MSKIWVFLCAALALAVAEEIEYHAHPKYSFEYDVNDPHTRDVKKQWERRDGDKVEGSYSLKEADGTVRIVDYHANDHTGFNAVVRREGHAIHPQVHHKEHKIHHELPVSSEVNIHETKTHALLPQSHAEVIIQETKIPYLHPKVLAGVTAHESETHEIRREIPVRSELAIHETKAVHPETHPEVSIHQTRGHGVQSEIQIHPEVAIHQAQSHRVHPQVTIHPEIRESTHSVEIHKEKPVVYKSQIAARSSLTSDSV